jgi:hypothetical protein
MEFAMRPFALVLLLCSASSLSAQAPSSTPPPKLQLQLQQHPELPKANPADVDTIEDIVHAFFSAISAPAGGRLNRERLDSLFVPDARIAIGLPRSPDRAADVTFLTVGQYADRSDAATATEGFFDRNIANHIQRFGVMAQVYSTYESRSHVNDPKPTARGIKSFELLNSADRWYIVQVYWDRERPDNIVPKRYLQNDSGHADEQR